jgi:hypothetical protein
MIDIIHKIHWPKLGIGIILGYAISWIYFIITLPFLIRLLGKVNGTIINYGLSWLLFIIVTYIIHSVEINIVSVS